MQKTNIALGVALLFMVTSCRADESCTTGVPCATDDDCGGGERCNSKLTPPTCQVLYCGTNGTVCDDDELCSEGYTCLKMPEYSVCVDGRKGDPCPAFHYDLSSSCQDGLWCKRADGESAFCASPSASGESCDPHRENSCKEGLWCNSAKDDERGAGKCDQRLGAGESCSPSWFQPDGGCANELWCNDVDYEKPRCDTPQGVGESCSSSESVPNGGCADGLACYSYDRYEDPDCRPLPNFGDGAGGTRL
jgi:hypothetical protein